MYNEINVCIKQRFLGTHLKKHSLPISFLNSCSRLPSLHANTSNKQMLHYFTNIECEGKKQDKKEKVTINNPYE